MIPTVPTVTAYFDPAGGLGYKYEHCAAAFAEAILMAALADLQRRLLVERLDDQRQHGVVLARPLPGRA